MIRTRFAPSPTGFLHIGGVRTALFSWAFARKQGGTFVLRIEDTDLERSTPESVKAIMDGMHWVGLDYDEGPFYQTQRFDRYKEVIQQLLASGHAYLCYCSKEELDALRAEQEARGEKPRYDRRWRPEDGKTLPQPPAGVQPVVRFKTPLTGSVVWEDAVKGRIEISNDELDDLIIARPDGSPTYNFCVVVADWDMNITHVIRGDDHVNNTPRQINILLALGAPLPVYGHLPMILNEDGQKMSKRRDAVSVVDYAAKGILPEALVNYLARLGWSHGDDEIFSRAQFLEWFNLDHLGRSAAQFDEAKLRWVNAQHLKALSGEALAALVQPFLAQRGIASDARLPALCDLLKDRCDTLVALADWLERFYAYVPASEEERSKHLTDAVRPAVAALATRLQGCAWDKAAINGAIKEVLAECGLKMPQLAMAVRVLAFGTAQTPSLDAMLELSEREKILAQLAKA